MILRQTALRASLLGIALFFLPARSTQAQVVFEKVATGDGSVPGHAVSNTDLLQTNLLSASRTGSAGFGNTYFYREDSGYTVDLARLYDGQFGDAGGEPSFSVLPNVVSITFNFNTSINNAGYNLSAIRTFAGWDDGRDGQAYTVEYSTVSSPTTFVALATVTRFDSAVGDPDLASTMVAMTAAAGNLANNVAALRFNFSGVENGGTAYREFDVFGTAASAIPEPSTYAAACGALMLGFATWRRRRVERAAIL